MLAPVSGFSATAGDSVIGLKWGDAPGSGQG